METEDTQVDQDNSSGSSSKRDSVCKKCYPVLSHYNQTFKSLVQQGSKLKKRKRKNTYPKRNDTASYRDINKQNEWLRNNVFDAMGNYLFCAACLKHGLQISFQQLSRQQKIKPRLR